MRTHCGGNIADVITFPKCVVVLPHVQHLWQTQVLCPGTPIMFLKGFRNIPCVHAACNNVAAFCHGRATMQDTMLPPRCVLVLPGLTFRVHDQPHSSWISMDAIVLLAACNPAQSWTKETRLGYSLLETKWSKLICILYVALRRGTLHHDLLLPCISWTAAMFCIETDRYIHSCFVGNNGSPRAEATERWVMLVVAYLLDILTWDLYYFVTDSASGTSATRMIFLRCAARRIALRTSV